MLQTTDFYPTREGYTKGRFPRNEPVIHADAVQRAEGPLSENELGKYERDGFLSLEGYFSPEAVAPFFDELDQIEKDPVMCQKDQVIMDPDQKKVRSVFDMHNLSSAFDRMTRDPHLLSMVQQLLGSDVYIHQSRINDKSGFCGNGFEWHSDFETWHSEDGMPAMRAVSASIMLTDNNAFNGPLMLIPGSHQSFVPCPGETPDNNWTESLKNQTVGVPPREAVADLANARGIEQPLGPAGSLLLFECNTLHASNANMSPWPRSNLFFVYNSVDNRLEKPFSGKSPRPGFLGARENTRPLTPVSD
ncbi:ectoine hydroxylase [Marinobacter vulgaris]|uniref:Ectoine hydroxylase n=1 Tax=Marinobacter vulgaris TaxID=1928331 RepID=A0A2V3ZKA8_9GAMM|nr:ectoine hydroxylase [Marinobacter vulgaris]PXX91631.1 ectoine hydroxylase [Marinobacter vulgaris]TSJ70866.1 ectoine hydroxylase [Marinobacter vulgaris]